MRLFDEHGEPTLFGYAVGLVVIIILLVIMAVLTGMIGGA